MRAKLALTFGMGTASNLQDMLGRCEYAHVRVLAANSEPQAMHAIAIHGGAGPLPREPLSKEQEAAHRHSLELALDAGYSILERGGSSLDAVVAAVRVMEDDPLFNAGRGAALTAAGTAELDAAVMDGRGQRAGAVAGVQHVKNPVELARCVMERTPHVLLVAAGAEELALREGLTLVPNEYFRTVERQRQLQSEQHAAATSGPALASQGTVGAVALDEAGNLAAATSTGGTTNKVPGRVGDSPLIGAGTYAKNGVCALSGTGHGESFIRAVAAYHICLSVEQGRLTLGEAAREMLHGILPGLGGHGGIIAVDHGGNIITDFSTEGMFRAARDARGRHEIALV
jgi:beta-aspartyl-peptidase (threonine type)